MMSSVTVFRIAMCCAMINLTVASVWFFSTHGDSIECTCVRTQIKSEKTGKRYILVRQFKEEAKETKENM